MSQEVPRKIVPGALRTTVRVVHHTTALVELHKTREAQLEQVVLHKTTKVAEEHRSRLKELLAHRKRMKALMEHHRKLKVVQRQAREVVRRKRPVELRRYLRVAEEERRKL